MIENHNICDFITFDKSFAPFNRFGHRDKQVIRQCIQNFSVAINIVRSNFLAPKILETGAGLSTVIFSKLLNFSGESIKTIDVFALDAIRKNSRGADINFSVSELANCEIIEGITIDIEELNAFYTSPESTLLSLRHKDILHNLNLFLNLDMEDRNYQKIINAINFNYISSSVIKDYLIKNSLFVNKLFNLYRTETDEFHFLKNSKFKPMLRTLLNEYSPNIIYLDSGEYSSVIEFNIIDELCKNGTLLIVQDIFFPKSIKSFLISSAIMASDRWRVLWIDRTTPQGMILCKKEV